MMVEDESSEAEPFEEEAKKEGVPCRRNSKDGALYEKFVRLHAFAPQCQ